MHVASGTQERVKPKLGQRAAATPVPIRPAANMFLHWLCLAATLPMGAATSQGLASNLSARVAVMEAKRRHHHKAGAHGHEHHEPVDLNINDLERLEKQLEDELESSETGRRKQRRLVRRQDEEDRYKSPRGLKAYFGVKRSKDDAHADEGRRAATVNRASDVDASPRKTIHGVWEQQQQQEAKLKQQQQVEQPANKVQPQIDGQLSNENIPSASPSSATPPQHIVAQAVSDPVPQRQPFSDAAVLAQKTIMDSKESLAESTRQGANSSTNSTHTLSEEERMEMELQAEAEELSQAQIHTKLQPKVQEKIPFMLLKSESIKAQCFLKCLEHNPLSNVIYIATCHRGPNQRWKVQNEMMQYEYGTFKARVCTDFDDWHKAEKEGFSISLPGKQYGFQAQSWTDCRANCFALKECLQAVYHKGTRSCKLMKKKLDYDQHDRGGKNVEYMSTQCAEGTGMPKCMTYTPATSAVTMLDCDSRPEQKWYFADHQFKSRVNNGCLSIKHDAVYGESTNQPWNELEVKDSCNLEESSQRWHWA